MNLQFNHKNKKKNKKTKKNKKKRVFVMNLMLKIERSTKETSMICGQKEKDMQTWCP